MPGVYKMLKQMLTNLQHLLQDFFLTILWAPGIIGLNQKQK